MPTSRSRKASIAILMLATLAFAQAAVALTACTMERGGLAQMPAGCESAASASDALGANTCVAHCTSDLQQTGVAGAVAPGVADAPVLIVSLAPPPWSRKQGLDSPPPGAPPRRILLHSFLI